VFQVSANPAPSQPTGRLPDAVSIRSIVARTASILIAPEDFELLRGKNALTVYTFGTGGPDDRERALPRWRRRARQRVRAPARERPSEIKDRGRPIGSSGGRSSG
jgi:hypothetical protein